MIDAIKQYEFNPLIRTYKSIPRKEFLSLMKASSVLIGNSSSGIIEAASFHTPVINIGTRQRGRERAENVLDSNYSKEDIKRNIRKCLMTRILNM
jgi:GDP/UDP-N,N'-diacetylbacillosamine 2-epimerase (hydrolysing)